MKIKGKIKRHFEEKKYAKVFRDVGKNYLENSNGYIVAFSTDFVIIQISGDFDLNGFEIIPVNKIIKVRYNRFDRYYEKIMEWEKMNSDVDLKFNIELSNWSSIFTSLFKNNKNIIVECESPEIDSFTIGPIKKISTKSVHIQNFDAAGYLNKKPSKIKYKNISKVIFDDRYIGIFSKYLRKRKKGNKK